MEEEHYVSSCLGTSAIKTLVQCDFDGTITQQDVSFLLLNRFASGNWKQLLKKCEEHKISVMQFNTQAFAMIRADKAALLKAIKGKVKIRAGFQELAAYCSRRDFKLAIVSYGLDFYIKAILREIGMEKIETYAAMTQFLPGGLKLKYIGPDGRHLADGLKEAYIKSFLGEGYRVIYVGNGSSDIRPAEHASQIIARGELLAYCRKNSIKCKSFDDLNDVVSALESLQQV